MERWLVKFVVLIIIFVVVFGMSILPIWVEGHFHRQGERGVRVISYLMCFGGGVFLAMYMLQMAPDATDILQTHVVEPYDINYPLPVCMISTILNFYL